ncbi:hypothetical protein KC976_04675 [Candidatus Saccharibacteria bacterium]|nr:hypothetical protein [Candidatus Saccharibacteria bacterium]
MAVTDEQQEALFKLLDKLDSETLNRLGPGVTALLQDQFSPEIRLSRLLEEQRELTADGDFAGAAALQAEIDLLKDLIAEGKKDTSSKYEWYAVILLALVLLVVLVWLMRG